MVSIEKNDERRCFLHLKSRVRVIDLFFKFSFSETCSCSLYHKPIEVRLMIPPFALLRAYAVGGLTVVRLFTVCGLWA